MSRQRVGSSPLFEARMGRAHCETNRLCVECGEPLSGRRTRWCSDQCVLAYKIRSHPQTARRVVFDRDRGICAVCRIDCTAIREAVREADRESAQRWLSWRNSRTGEQRTHTGFRAGGVLSRSPLPGSYHSFAREGRIPVLSQFGMEKYWWRKTWWDVDHVVAVNERGGQCGLSNLQTLCVLCHRDRSVGQRRRWKGSRQLPRMKQESCTEQPPCRLGSGDLCVGCSSYRNRILRSGK